MASGQYLYCIVEGGNPEIEDCRGLEGAPVEAVACRDHFSAVISSLSRSQAAPTMENLSSHERLVETLMDRQTLLPARFGTVLRDKASVKAALLENRWAFRRGLDRVRGKVELGVRVLTSQETREGASQPGVPSAPMTGTSYLMERLGLHARAREARDRLNSLSGSVNENLSRHAGDYVTFTSSGKTVMNIAYLVHRDKVAEFKRAVEEQQAVYPELSFLLTGPWPAYSFVPPVEENPGVLVSHDLAEANTN